MWNNAERLNVWAKFFMYSAAACFIGIVVVLWFLEQSFAIQRVIVYGKFDRIPLSELQSQVHRQLKGNFFTADLTAVRDALTVSPWVRQVKVYRRWPSTVVVAVEEQQAIARWKLGGLINRYGEWFDAYEDHSLLVFDGHEQAFPELASLLAKFDYSLKKANIHLRQIQFNSRRAWTFELTGGHTIELGQNDTERRVERLAYYWPLLRENLNQELRYILDMRYPNGLAVSAQETL